MTNFENLIENMTPEKLAHLIAEVEVPCDKLGYDYDGCHCTGRCEDCALRYLQQVRQVITMGSSRMAEKCAQCPYKGKCDKKRMEALAMASMPDNIKSGGGKMKQVAVRTRPTQSTYLYEPSAFGRLNDCLKDGYRVVMCNAIGNDLEYILEKPEGDNGDKS